MGVDFYCNNITFGCSYGGWAEIRKTIILATFKYLKEKFEDKEKYGDECEDFCYVKLIQNLIEKFEYIYNAMGCSNNLLSILNSNLIYQDALIHFDLGGLYSLCNKSDCEGYYTPGNSLDICKLLDIIKDSLHNLDSEYDWIYDEKYEKYDGCDLVAVSVYQLFKYSYENNKKIRIS